MQETDGLRNKLAISNLRHRYTPVFTVALLLFSLSSEPSNSVSSNAPVRPPIEVAAATTIPAGVVTGRVDAVAKSRFSLGVNIASLAWWNNGRVFANLVLGNGWQFGFPNESWTVLDAMYQDSDGWIAALPDRGMAFRSLNHPRFVFGSTEIVCRYVGRGKVELSKSTNISEVFFGKGMLRFIWKTEPPKDNEVENIFLILSEIDPKNPIRNIDCREKELDPAVRFDPVFIESLRGYSTVRFLGLQQTNENRAVTWATRKLGSNSSAATADGVAIEDLILLANTAGVNPWFTLPWFSDDEYIRNFAQLVRDNLNPELTVYLEVSNEVWNGAFPVAKVAQVEGLTRGLSSNPYEAQLRRYAERSTEVFKIWTSVFSDRPSALVRVIATQNANPETTKIVLSHADTLKYVDAVATAPYFYFDPSKLSKTSSLATIFTEIERGVDKALLFAAEQQQLARNYGKRFIAYEAGQHIVLPNNVPLLKALNTDERMENAYKRYLSAWKSNFDDLMVLLADVSPINRYGAWGMREYAGQPLSDAPKARAVSAFLN